MIITLTEALLACSSSKFFQIKDGHIKSSNDMVTYCSPIKLDIDCNPNARDLKSAVSKIDATPIFTLNTNGKLSIKSGVFRALIPCSESIPPIEDNPSGRSFEVDGCKLFNVLKKLTPFTSTDISNDRVWANGILFRGGNCYATNNVILIQHKSGITFPINALLPLKSILIILKIEGDVIKLQYDSNSITFHYSNGKWLKSRLYNQKWDSRIFEMFNSDSSGRGINPEIFKGVSMVKSDTDNFGSVHFHDNGVSSKNDINDGLFYEIPGLNTKGIYNAHMFGLLEGVIDKVDLSRYPEPARFQGDSLKGLINGCVK